jgi:CheY-like chemotaxis protein
LKELAVNILIVDDDHRRVESLRTLLIEKSFVEESKIEVAKNTQQAKDFVRNKYYDILILDVVLPRRDEPPSASEGISFLDQVVRRPQLKKPGRIIGITAFLEDIEKFRTQFDNYCFNIIEASHSNLKWKKQIVEAISYQKVTKSLINTTDIQAVCLTVHGIQTRGNWQQNLEDVISRDTDRIRFETFKFGYFSILSFFVPFLRWAVIYRFKNCLLNISQQEPEKKIFIFGHSFGTYIIVKAIESILHGGHQLNLHLLVLSGSVLKSGHSFELLIRNTDVKIVNDCGVDDNILLLSETIVPNTGMSGRTGFKGLNNNRFVNRFFRGGHSHYFEQESSFISKFWLPLFSNELNLKIIDEREDSWFKSNVIEGGASLIGKFKEIILASICIYYFFFN